MQELLFLVHHRSLCRVSLPFYGGLSTPGMMKGRRTINTRDDERKENYQHPEVLNGNINTLRS